MLCQQEPYHGKSPTPPPPPIRMGVEGGAFTSNVTAVFYLRLWSLRCVGQWFESASGIERRVYFIYIYYIVYFTLNIFCTASRLKVRCSSPRCVEGRTGGIDYGLVAPFSYCDDHLIVNMAGIAQAVEADVWQPPLP